jgi:isoquinoline 1-oxidoreductase beta subunit
MSAANLDRRSFLKTGAAAGGGLLISIYFPAVATAEKDTTSPASFTPNAFLRIDTDNRITLIVGQSEMGQGVLTSLPMLIAEELEVDFGSVHFEQAPADKAYFNPSFRAQLTGGSASVRSFYEPLRKAGATAREMLIQAAAQTWNVPVTELKAERGAVIQATSGRRLSYGELAAKAATLAAPPNVRLKDPKDFKLITKSVTRLDTADKVDGAAIFGIDVKLPGMLTAAVLRCPVFGGQVASFDDSKARTVSGVKRIVQIDSGVAVVAENFWSAKKGRDALEVKWNEGSRATQSGADITRMFVTAVEKPGAVARKEGDVEAALAKAAQKIEAVYEVPYLAHATMEPMNCVADVRADRCEVWGGMQAQTWAQSAAAKIAGLPPEKINVHTTMLGGGFGRRAESDFVIEAVQISKAVGAPVKVIWTREDDMQHDSYRPGAYHKFSAGLDANGNVIAWLHRTSSSSIYAAHGFGEPAVDGAAVEGAKELPYAIPNLQVEWARQEPGIPVGFWRSVGHSHTAFVTECFIDELAAAVGKDPFEFRRGLLEKEPRHKRVLELAATKADWSKSLPKGQGRGLAVAESFGTFVAQVAEVTVNTDGRVRVNRVVCAVDCGPYVNPNTIEAQMQGGIVYGLTAALKGEITIENGRVKQRNFHDYEMLRMNEMPRVEVHIVPSTDKMGGIGEPGTPPIAPAVVNAIYAATGKRIRKLPIGSSV